MEPICPALTTTTFTAGQPTPRTCLQTAACLRCAQRRRNAAGLSPGRRRVPSERGSPQVDAVRCVVALAVGAASAGRRGARLTAPPRRRGSSRRARLRTPSSSSRRPASRGASTSSSSRARSASSRTGKVRAAPFLDIRSRVVAGGEQGLLGLAFPKNYAKTRTFYVNYTAAGSGATVVDRYRVRSGTSAPRQPAAAPDGAAALLEPQRRPSRCSARTGSSGSGSATAARAATPRTARRTARRCSARCSASTSRSASPSPELVALGLRNPWRYTFDRRTGDLWIGDVGQNEIEEVSVLRRPFGGLVNFGWDVYEGRARFEDKELGPGRLVQPIAQYTHASGLLDHRRVRLPRHGRREPRGTATSTATTAAARSGASRSAGGTPRVEPVKVETSSRSARTSRASSTRSRTAARLPFR